MIVKKPPRSTQGYPAGRARPIKKSDMMSPTGKALYHKRQLFVLNLPHDELVDLYLACVQALAGSAGPSDSEVG